MKYDNMRQDYKKAIFPHFTKDFNPLESFRNIFGDKVKIYGNSISLKRHIYQPLKIHSEVKISSDNYSEVAKVLLESISPTALSAINENTEDLLQKPPKIFDKLGIHSKYKKAIAEFYMNPKSREQILSKEILPLLTEYANIKFVTPVSVDITYQQSIFSLLKMHTLIGVHGKEKLKELVFEKEVFSGIEMRGAIPVLTFVDAYLHNSQISTTLPINTLGTSWHFYADGPLLMSHELSSSFLSNFQSELKPLIGERKFLPLEAKNQDYIWRMLRFAVGGVNEILGYANDFFNFLLPNGEVDSLKQIQFFGALHLIFADINAMNLTTDEYIRTSLSFNFIYKLANLCRSRSEIKGSDNDFVEALLSTKFKDEIINLLDNRISSTPDVHAALKAIVTAIYDDFHSELAKIFPNTQVERERLWKFRSFRNYYSHGTFLNTDRFEEIFPHSPGAIPYEILYFPAILLIALSCNAEVFFSRVNANVEPYKQIR